MYEEYIAADDNITVWGTLDDADIIREQQVSSDEEGEEEMEGKPEDIPTMKYVLKAGDVYSRALKRQGASKGLWFQFYNVRDVFEQTGAKKTSLSYIPSPSFSSLPSTPQTLYVRKGLEWAVTMEPEVSSEMGCGTIILKVERELYWSGPEFNLSSFYRLVGLGITSSNLEGATDIPKPCSDKREVSNSGLEGSHPALHRVVYPHGASKQANMRLRLTQRPVEEWLPNLGVLRAIKLSYITKQQNCFNPLSLCSPSLYLPPRLTLPGQSPYLPPRLTLPRHPPVPPRLTLPGHPHVPPRLTLPGHPHVPPRLTLPEHPHVPPRLTLPGHSLRHFSYPYPHVSEHNVAVVTTSTSYPRSRKRGITN
uniref:Uncharacterized protein n=1 Tax=Timema tahoe TaxID=61484 RepID=A0A7R9IAT7_9NEOP|nr:unnamed protein product [Timema tahoe]